MKQLLALAAAILIACDDPGADPGPDEPTRLDAVMGFALAAEDWAIRCNYPNADYFAEWISERHCASHDCDEPMQIDMAPCVAALEARACSDELLQEWPAECVDPLWP